MNKIINIFAGLLLGMSSMAFGFQNREGRFALGMHVAPGQQRTLNVREIMGKDVWFALTNGANHGVVNTALWPLVSYQPHAGFRGADYFYLSMLDVQNRIVALLVTVITEPAKP